MPIDGHYADLRPAAQAARPYPAIVPDAAAAAANRQAAAAIRLCLDLQQHSAAALSFLHEVHQHPRLADPGFLAAAVRRYERCWLPLLATHASVRAIAAEQASERSSGAGGAGGRAAAATAAGNGSAAAHEVAVGAAGAVRGGRLAAPLDVAWVWWAHAIAPAAYRQDLEAVLPPAPAAALWSDAAAGLAPHVRPAAALATAQALWEAAFPEEPFHLPGLEPPYSDSAAGVGPRPNGAAPAAAQPLRDSSGAGSSSGHGSAAEAQRGQHDAMTASNGRATCSYDIIAAAVRQFDFYWSACLPHYREGWFLAAAVARYKQFLHLHAVCRGQFLVPPYDVDLLWHTHMACSAEYYADCEALFGAVFAHDDSVNDRTPGSKLNTNWATTQELYYTKLGESLAGPGAMWRGPPPPAWATGPAAAALAAGLDAAALGRPRVYALTDAATGGPLLPAGSRGAADPKDGWRGVVRASLAGGAAADDRLLLLQHWGPVSRAALVQVVTLDGRVEALARLVGRESLPVAEEGPDPHRDPMTPALHYSPPGSAGPLALDTLERAFSIMSPSGDWGVAIARRPAAVADQGAVPLAVDLYRLDPRGGATQAVWRMRAQHAPGGARLWFGPDDDAAKHNSSNSSSSGALQAADSSSPRNPHVSKCANGRPEQGGAEARSGSSTAAAAATSDKLGQTSGSTHSAADTRPPQRPGKLRRALVAALRLGSGGRKQAAAGSNEGGLARSAADERPRAQAAAAACEAARLAFADLGSSFRGVSISLGGPAAQPAGPAAQPAGGAGKHAAQNGRLHNGAGSGASGSQAAADGAAAQLGPATAAAAAGSAGHANAPAAVAVAAGEGAAEALALAGAVALQGLMLAGLSGGDPQLFSEGLFAAPAVGPGFRAK